MNFLIPRFNCFCKFSRSHFKRNYEYIDVSSIFYFFSFVGFSHRDVWKFDILFSSHYRRCITGVLQLRQMLQQWMYLLWPIAFRSTNLIHWVNLNCHTRLLYGKKYIGLLCRQNQDNFVFAKSHIFHLLCDFIDDHFQKWKEFLPYEQKCIGN